LSELSEGAGGDLQRVLTSPSNVRADVIRQFYGRGDDRMVEVLADLEADDLLRLQVIRALQAPRCEGRFLTTARGRKTGPVAYRTEYASCVTAVIEIPNSASIRPARGFLAKLDWSLNDTETLIRFHDRWCYMQPWVLAAPGAWGLEAQARDVKIKLKNAHRAAYAWRFGLGEYLGVDPGDGGSAARRGRSIRGPPNRCDESRSLPGA